MFKGLVDRRTAATCVAALLAWALAAQLLDLPWISALLAAAIFLAYLALIVEKSFGFAAIGCVATWLVLTIFTERAAIWALVPVACGQDCTIQGWMSASSGWAAVIVAGIGFFFIQRQIDEQRRQTDFIIGNENPTLDSVQHLKDPEEIVLRVVNWNRRGILIHDVDFLERDWFTGIMEVKIDGAVVENPALPLFVRGWEDRNNAGPLAVQFSLSAHERHADVLIRDWPRGQEMYADIQILGEKHASKRLTCFLPD